MTLVDWLTESQVDFFAVPNGAVIGGRNRFAMVRKLRREGMQPGVPDLCIITRPPLCPDKTAWVEMKRCPEARPKVSPQQRHWHDIIHKNEGVVVIGYGAADAIAKLKGLGFGS